jgi:hypothetical protein
MATRTMVIMRGNGTTDTTMYPDETGKTVAWPVGALHVKPAKDYATLLGYDALVLDVPGQPQGQLSPQAKAAWGAFLKDQSVTAFYGFSGGGYNLRDVLDYLLAHAPEQLYRIDRVVVFGSPKQPEHEYMAAKYQALLKAKYAALARRNPGLPKWGVADWTLVYRKNPLKSALPKDVSQNLETHMFGPETLLREQLGEKQKDLWQP